MLTRRGFFGWLAAGAAAVVGLWSRRVQADIDEGLIAKWRDPSFLTGDWRYVPSNAPCEYVGIDEKHKWPSIGEGSPCETEHLEGVPCYIEVLNCNTPSVRVSWWGVDRNGQLKKLRELAIAERGN